jgi:hypothetical protein
MGGLPAGKVEATEHAYAPWEKRVDALMVLLNRKGHLKVDELRKNIEALGAHAYDAMSYYERWISSICQTMLQRGLVSADELGRRMEDVRRRDRAGEL